jgi:hypothetical protein
VVLAELEIRHSRVIAPTRRVALGDMHLPADPAPGLGGLLLAGVLGAYVWALEAEMRDELDRLLYEVEHGYRIAQPRLRHRLQTDAVGLVRSRHCLVRTARGTTSLEIHDDHGAVLPHLLGAIYAADRLPLLARPAVFRLLRRASRWQGGPDERLLRYLTSDEASLRWRATGDESWARRVLGFPAGSEPLRAEVVRSFRRMVREVHPDHGATADGAGDRIGELAEAKRILLAGS